MREMGKDEGRMSEATARVGDLGPDHPGGDSPPAAGDFTSAASVGPGEYVWQEDQSAGAEFDPGEQPFPATPARRPATPTRPLTDEDWQREDEFWNTQSYIAVSGRLAVPRPRTHPIKPPQRFHPMARWVSIVALGVVGALIVLGCMGVLQASSLANNLLHPQVAPTQVHPSPTASPSATATPKRHK